ncbi:MAG: hypothetical protein PUB96_00825 [Helicobacteraceae bacterium]|nr:hypothetical protein [Helicobacteraceae bacterium]
MRVAVCFYGFMRTYRLTKDKFFKNIVEANIKDGFSFDIFIHTFDKWEQSWHGSWHKRGGKSSYGELDGKAVSELDKEWLNRDYDAKEVSFDSLDEGEFGFIKSLEGVTKLVSDYEKKHNFKYDLYLYTRLDILFCVPCVFLSYFRQYRSVLGYKNPHATWPLGGYSLQGKFILGATDSFSRARVNDPRHKAHASLFWLSSQKFSSDEFLLGGDGHFAAKIDSPYMPYLFVEMDYRFNRDFYIQRLNYVLGRIFSICDSVDMQDNKSIEKVYEILQNLPESERIFIINRFFEIIDEKNKIIDSQAHRANMLQGELHTLRILKDSKRQSKQEGALSRVRNHLAYKLGAAMVINSKSIFGYICLPFVLSYIKKSHKLEMQKRRILGLRLPSLDSFSDYDKAVREKNCLTYKLGEALIYANKSWYKGGYIWLLFEAQRLKAVYKSKKGGI